MNDEYFSKVSPWFDATNLTEMFKILKIGDIVQMTGSKLPTQWAICVKVKQTSAVVVYRDTLSRVKDEFQSTRSVQKHGLGALIGKRKVRINNVNDNHFPVEPCRTQIVNKAEFFFQFPHLVKEVRNFACFDEHKRLVTLCRYDLKCVREIQTFNRRKHNLSWPDKSSETIPDSNAKNPSGKGRKNNSSSSIKPTGTIPKTQTQNFSGKNCCGTNHVVARLLKSTDSEHEKLKKFVLDFKSYKIDNCRPSSRYYVSKWLNGAELTSVLFERLNVGDLIEVGRVGYSHWSVCVRVFDDDAILVHRIDDAKSKSAEDRIRLTSLKVLVREDRVRINNSRDTKFHVLSTVAVLFKVNFYVKYPENIGEHHPINNNCEHFATFCRYGVKCSINGKVLELEVTETAAAAKGKMMGARVAAATGGRMGQIEELALSVVQDLFKAAVDDYANVCPTNENIKKKLCDRVPRLG